MYQTTESGGIKHYGGIKDADGNVIEEGCLCRNECKSGRGQGRHALQQKAVQNKQKILAAAERKLQEFEIKILETRAALTQEVADATAALLEVLKDPTSHHAWQEREQTLDKPDPNAHWALLGRLSLPANVPGWGCALLLNISLFSVFCKTAAFRIARGWARYVAHIKFDPAYLADEFESAVAQGEIKKDFLSVKSGCPYRALNKESVLWIDHLQARLPSPKDIDPEQHADVLVHCLVSIVLYRGWFNSFERWTDFERKFGLDEGQLLDESFSAANFVEASLATAVGIDGKRRGGAYNPGCYGATVGEEPEERLWERISIVIFPILRARAREFASVVSSGVPASREASLLFLSFVSLFLGPFVAYQVVLDVSYIFPELFNESLCVDMGPGAVAELSSLFGVSPSDGNMVRSRKEQQAACPMCFEVASHISNPEYAGYNCEGAMLLRDVCARFRLPAFGPQHCEYWGCELRQIASRLAKAARRDVARLASHQYLAALEAPFFSRFFVPYAKTHKDEWAVAPCANASFIGC